MITTPSVPVAGTSGRPAPVVAPIHQIAEEAAQRRAQNLETQGQSAAASRTPQTESVRALAANPPADRARRYIAEREEATRDRLSREAAQAAYPEAPPVKTDEDEAGPQVRKSEMIDLLPPPATEVLAKGGRQSRVEARAEIFEAEARLRVTQSAVAGYDQSRSALG